MSDEDEQGPSEEQMDGMAREMFEQIMMTMGGGRSTHQLAEWLMAIILAIGEKNKSFDYELLLKGSAIRRVRRLMEDYYKTNQKRNPLSLQSCPSPSGGDVLLMIKEMNNDKGDAEVDDSAKGQGDDGSIG